MLELDQDLVAVHVQRRAGDVNDLTAGEEMLMIDTVGVPPVDVRHAVAVGAVVLEHFGGSSGLAADSHRDTVELRGNAFAIDRRHCAWCQPFAGARHLAIDAAVHEDLTRVRAYHVQVFECAGGIVLDQALANVALLHGQSVAAGLHLDLRLVNPGGGLRRLLVVVKASCQDKHHRQYRPQKEDSRVSHFNSFLESALFRGRLRVGDLDVQRDAGNLDRRCRDVNHLPIREEVLMIHAVGVPPIDVGHAVAVGTVVLQHLGGVAGVAADVDRYAAVLTGGRRSLVVDRGDGAGRQAFAGTRHLAVDAAVEQHLAGSGRDHVQVHDHARGRLDLEAAHDIALLGGQAVATGLHLDRGLMYAGC